MNHPNVSRPPSRIEIIGIPGLPRFKRGDDLGSMVVEAANRAELAVASGDVIVVAQKAVSKAEGRVVDVSSVKPGDDAVTLAGEIGKDPRLVQVVLDESVRIVRAVRGILIVETRHGLICANAGVDASNVDGEGCVTLLPEDPDASARRIRESVRAADEVDVAVIVSDSFNRPWRMGSINVAIGVAGMKPLDDRRGTHDDNGNPLRVTIVGIADEIASAAQLVMGEVGGVAAAIVKGFPYEPSDDGSGATMRPAEQDLFR